MMNTSDSKTSGVLQIPTVSSRSLATSRNDLKRAIEQIETVMGERRRICFLSEDFAYTLTIERLVSVFERVAYNLTFSQLELGVTAADLDYVAQNTHYRLSRSPIRLKLTGTSTARTPVKESLPRPLHFDDRTPVDLSTLTGLGTTWYTWIYLVSARSSAY